LPSAPGCGSLKEIFLEGLFAMQKQFWTIREVIESFSLEESFLDDLEKEDILCPVSRAESPEKLFSADDLEKLRLCKILVEDMQVNLPGVEIILRLRQNMFEMRRQFDDILEDMSRRIQDMLKNE
jgi:MerR family transcriptional regulator/heat shock protein HspR